MKSTLALFSLMAASAMASDPCATAEGEKACGIMNACMWVEKPGGHSSKNHQDHHNLNRGCHMIGVTDRDSIKGHSRHGAADTSEHDALVKMGFHTTIEEMACEEAFTKRDCRVLSKRGVSCKYECTNLDDFSGSCVPAGDTPESEQFNKCMVPIPKGFTDLYLSHGYTGYPAEDNRCVKLEENGGTDNEWNPEGHEIYSEAYVNGCFDACAKDAKCQKDIALTPGGIHDIIAVIYPGSDQDGACHCYTVDTIEDAQYEGPEQLICSGYYNMFIKNAHSQYDDLTTSRIDKCGVNEDYRGLNFDRK